MAQLPTPTFSPAAGPYGPAQSVTFISGGATYFFYTTDGITTPTETLGVAGLNTTKVAAATPVSVAATETIKVLAYNGTDPDSGVATGAYIINGACAAPTFLPAAGYYSTTQSCTMATVTSGASIAYTTNGSTPASDGAGNVTNGTLYPGSAVSVPATITFKAIAFKVNYVDSSPVTAWQYQILAMSSVTPSTDTIGPVGATAALGGGIVTGGATGSDNVTDWSSDTTGVATVSGSGVVTAVAGGTATVTAMADKLHSLTHTSAITVVAITAISPASATLDTIGENLQLTGAVVTGGTPTTVTWSSSNTGVATVSATGLVTAVGSGLAVITATSDELSAAAVTASITVGALTLVDTSHMQAALTEIIQGLSPANPLLATQRAALVTALANLRSNSLTQADLQLLQSLASDLAQTLGPTNPFTGFEQTVVAALLKDLRSLI
jgi:hypothetical protein